MEKRQQELQFLGFSGVFKESFKIIFSKPKLFTQITLTFILPLSILYQFHQYSIHSISSKRFVHWILWEFSYYLVILIPSLLSASAIVCAVTFLYGAKDVTFKKIGGMLPKMWKRVMITFALSFAIDFCYHSFIGRVKTSIVQHLFPDLHQPVNAAEIVTTKTIIAIIISFSYKAGHAYIRILRNLATVVSVIEDLSGKKAWIKSKNLVNSKIGVAVFLWLVFGICSNKIDDRIYDRFLGPDDGYNWRNGIGIGIPCLILLQSLVSLLEFVVYTVIYFSCKSHEVTRRVLTTQSHQINFKSIWWSVLDPLME
ncbi:hypothetical protein Pint_27351 [Pistacia integerrima]|uniref:Uncharacterized protein n=1 Tax=Pistacia integerrima TaxID=434235 RepID=A0ACC0YUY8_9ROSI|nr:hypothetical protein Pint_27351 [Pistacia integerrima]